MMKSASMKRLSLGDLQHENRANSEVFVFSGGSASSRRRHHQTTSSAPVTPHTNGSDSGAARTDLNTPNSASGPLFKFEKPLRDGDQSPFQVRLQPGIVEEQYTNWLQASSRW